MASMRRADTRQQLDKSVSVADYIHVLNRFMEKKQSRDLLLLLAPLHKQTFTTAARLPMLMQFHKLVIDLLKMHPNTIVSHVYLKLAAKHCHQKQACLWGTRPLEIELGAMSAGLRMLMSKWRGLVQYPEKYRVLAEQAGKIAWEIATHKLLSLRQCNLGTV